MGLIRTGTGSGPNAGAIVIASPTGGFSALLRLQVAAQGLPIADVVATRLLLEEWVARTLANASEPDLSAAVDTLDAMDDDELTPAEFLALDAAFHVALAQASGNLVVAATMEGLRSSIEGYVRGAVESIPDWPAEAERLRSEHRGVLDAITARDSDAAARRVRDHITHYYENTRPHA